MSYIAPSDLAEWLGIDDTEDDARLTYACNAASEAVEKHCGQVFSTSTSASARTFRTCDPCCVELAGSTIQSTSGLIVKTDEGNSGSYDRTWAITTDFVLSPYDGIVDGVSGFPYTKIHAVPYRYFPTFGPRPRVQVTALWGWATIPEAVVQATRLKAARLFRRFSSPDGIAGGLDLGLVRISRFEDPDVVMLLAPFTSVAQMVA